MTLFLSEYSFFYQDIQESIADVEKPIAEHLQDLQKAYPNIEASKIFQQLLICQRKIILSGNTLVFQQYNVSKTNLI